MNKKIIKAAIVSVCAVCAAASAFAFTACSGKTVEPETYYNKTITFTGKAYSYGFDTKGEYDNYGNLGGNTTQRKILETYWDDIDWDYTLGETDKFKNTDEVKEFLDSAQENAFKNWKDLSFTVTKTDTVSITLNLPEEFKDLGWGTSVTMPLYEDGNKLTDYGMQYDLKEGYWGVGVKEEGNKRLTVSVCMEKNFVNNGGKKNVYMDSVRLNINAQLKDENGGISEGGYLDSSTLGRGVFYSHEVKIDEFSSSRDDVLAIYFYPEVTITDAE